MRRYLLPVLVAGVGIAFAAACLLAWLTRGRGLGLRAKLRLGGLLLTLTGVTATMGLGCVMCYDSGPGDNEFVFDAYSYNTPLAINLSQTNILHGTIHYRTVSSFSWALYDEVPATSLASNNIIPADGAFDQTTERFLITLPEDLDNGAYKLRLYPSDVTNQHQTWHRMEIPLVINSD
jgi:hypothetical protein